MVTGSQPSSGLEGFAGRRCKAISSMLVLVFARNELLEPLRGLDLAGVIVAAGIDSHLVYPVELAGVASIVSEGSQHCSALADDDADDVILSVGIN
jgi:hypothetical protein